MSIFQFSGFIMAAPEAQKTWMAEIPGNGDEIKCNKGGVDFSVSLFSEC